MNDFKGKKILITGGLGSIGSAIVEQLVAFEPKEVRVLDNRETEIFYARQQYADKPFVRFLYGNVREKEQLMRATKDVDIVFHAAALKHVILCEYDPFEAVKTNVNGTQNLIESAIDNNVEKVIFISTDKAVNPSNVMGTTKLLAERLISSMYYHKGESKTRFGAVRFGNVLSSRGSVLEIWEEELARGEKISVTDPEMTRFFMTIPESVKLIFSAAQHVKSGETFIFKMPAVKIGVLAEAFLELHGRSKDDLKIIGKREGEKAHEELLLESEVDLLLENKELYVRLPLIKETAPLYQSFLKQGFKRANVTDLSSKNEEILLDKAAVKQVLAPLLKVKPA